jgi:uncharacterized protein with PQ loop repeat
MTTTQILGFVATGLVIVGYIPQIVHLIKERCTAGISIWAFSLWWTASLLFLIHASMIGDAVFVGAQTVNLVAGGLIVGFCKQYEGEVCPFHRGAYSGVANTGPKPCRGDPAGRYALSQKGSVWRARGLKADWPLGSYHGLCAKPVLLHLPPQGDGADLQRLRGLAPVAAKTLQRALDHGAFLCLKVEAVVGGTQTSLL